VVRLLVKLSSLICASRFICSVIFNIEVLCSFPRASVKYMKATAYYKLQFQSVTELNIGSEYNRNMQMKFTF